MILFFGIRPSLFLLILAESQEIIMTFSPGHSTHEEVVCIEFGANLTPPPGQMQRRPILLNQEAFPSKIILST